MIDTAPGRVLLFGISGATWSVLDPLLDLGALPNLATLCDRGTSAVVASDLAPGDDQFRPQVAWATAATGCTADRHGITRFFHEGSDLRARTLWDYWAQAGSRVGVYGWPGTWPPKPYPGFVIPSHLARDERTWPPELAFLRALEQDQRRAEREGESFRRLVESGALLRRLRRHGVRGRTMLRLTSSALRVARGDSEEAALALREARLHLAADVFVRLCRLFRPDFMAFVTFFVDFASHRYWRYYEPDAFPQERRRPSRTLRSAVIRSYRHADHALGQLVTLAGGDCLVVVLSEHGMCAEPNPSEIGKWRIVLRPQQMQELAGADSSVAVCPIARWLVFRQDGRDSSVLPRIADNLRQMRFAQSGQPAFEIWERLDEVVVRLALSPAEHAVGWETAVIEGAGRRVELGDLARALGRARSAMHDGQAVAVLAGPGVPHRRERASIRLVDVAPTLMALGGLDPPTDLDGCSFL